jgi:hypothetical protein
VLPPKLLEARETSAGHRHGVIFGGRR